MESKFACDALIAENKMAYELKQAEFTQEVSCLRARCYCQCPGGEFKPFVLPLCLQVKARQAEADMAYDLQANIEQQQIKEQKMQIEVIRVNN